MNALWPRAVAAFVLAPTVVPAFFFAYDAIFLGGGWDLGRFVGSVLTYGVYAYLFAILFGFPTLLVLVRTGNQRLWHFAVAAGCIGLLGAGAMVAVGLRPTGLVVGALAGIVAGAIFHTVGGYPRSRANPQPSSRQEQNGAASRE